MLQGRPLEVEVLEEGQALTGDAQEEQVGHRARGRRRLSRQGPGEPAATTGPVPDLFFLGVSREGLAFLKHLDLERSPLKRRIVAIDFNPETLERLQAEGIVCHYGDIGNADTLRHAGIERAAVVVS